MCGRYSITSPFDQVRQLFQVSGGSNLQPRYNIAPTQTAPVVRLNHAGERELANLRWGLVPSWSKDASGAVRMINARSETVATMPAYREAIKARRCLIVADGFYEWEKLSDGSKQPWRFTLSDCNPFAFAGLWERWTPKTGETLETFTVLTTTANELVAPIHNRMPVILPTELHAAWLGEERSSLEKLTEMLRPYASSNMNNYRVAPIVNNWRNDVAECFVAITDKSLPNPERTLI